MSSEKPLPCEPPVPELLKEILALEGQYEETTSTPQPCCVNSMTNSDKDKFNSLLHITEHRLYQIVKWARHLPNFLNVDTRDQILLLQNAWAELTCFGVIWRSRDAEGFVRLSYGKTIDMKKAKEMNYEENISRVLYVCSNFKRLEVDQYEYVALKVLSLMLPDIAGLRNRVSIQQHRNNLLEALLSHTTTNYPHYPLRFAELLLIVSEVQRLTAITRQRILHLQSPEIAKNKLLMELLQHNNFNKASTLTVEQALNVIQTNYKHETITPPCSFTPSSNQSPSVSGGYISGKGYELTRQDAVSHSELVGNNDSNSSAGSRLTRQDSVGYRVIVIKG